MQLWTKRKNRQFCAEEAAAEIVLCRVVGIPYLVDRAAIAQINVAGESVGLVVVPWDEDSIELYLEHILDLAVDIVVVAKVRLQDGIVRLIGWLPSDRICKLCAYNSNSRTALAIDSESLESIDALAMKVRGDYS